MSRKPNTPRNGRSLHVMVVDDSAVVRQIMSAVLSQEPGIAVTVAADPLIAMGKMQRSRPDVMLLDLEMPRMDGLTFLRKIMAEDPIPVVVCSGFTGAGTEAAVRALEHGAVEIVTKPQVGIQEFLHESAVRLIDAVRAAAQARVRRRTAPPVSAPHRLTADAVLPRRRLPRSRPATEKIVGVGASTGGTEALRALLEPMPPDAPPMVIVQHMPEYFTAAFAERLNRTCRIEVGEAADGDEIVQGRALIARGDRHLLVRRTRARYVAEVTDGPLVSRHRPSVDVLFRSLAQAAGPNAVGVIMTGMGNDGAEGLLEMKQSGGATIAQDEATSVVFAMARAAIDLGAVDTVVPLPRLSEAVLRSAAARSRRPARSPRAG